MFFYPPARMCEDPSSFWSQYVQIISDPALHLISLYYHSRWGEIVELGFHFVAVHHFEWRRSGHHIWCNMIFFQLLLFPWFVLEDSSLTATFKESLNAVYCNIISWVVYRRENMSESSIPLRNENEAATVNCGHYQRPGFRITTAAENTAEEYKHCFCGDRGWESNFKPLWVIVSETEGKLTWPSCSL